MPAAAVAVVVILFIVLSGGDEDDSGDTTTAVVAETTTTTTTEPQDSTEESGAEPGAEQEPAESEQPPSEPADSSSAPEDSGDEPGDPIIVVRDGAPVDGVAELEYSKGDDVRFRVRSDVAEEVHVHGYDIFMEVEAGGSVDFDFPADIDGIFEVELEGSHTQIAELRVNP
ncbi:MAG: hypothetical protein ACR2N5_02325 [Solirubrobacterales bacterium]